MNASLHPHNFSFLPDLTANTVFKAHRGCLQIIIIIVVAVVVVIFKHIQTKHSVILQFFK